LVPELCGTSDGTALEDVQPVRGVLGEV